MKNMVAFLFAATCAVVVASAQSSGPTPTPQPTNMINPFCSSGQTRIVHSNWNGQQPGLWLICAQNGAVLRHDFLAPALAVQQTAPGPFGGASLYAYSQSRLSLFDLSGNQPSQLYWLTPGGGYLAPQGDNTALLRLPWVQDAVFMYLYQGSKYDIGQTPPGLLARCGAEVQAFPSGNSFCLDPSSWVIWFAKAAEAVGVNWSSAVAILGDRRPVGMAVLGETVYVLLGDDYESSPDGTLQIKFGSLVAVTAAFSGDIHVQTLKSGLDIETDLSQQRIAVSQEGVYFVSYGQLGGYRAQQIVFYNFLSNNLEVIVPPDITALFSGLSIWPSQ